MDFKYSKHALEEIADRKISKEIVDSVLRNPQQIIDHGINKMVYQSVVEFTGDKTYLVRVIVAIDKEPNVVITLYKTSKIEKYWSK